MTLDGDEYIGRRHSAGGRPARPCARRPL
jgi:hypothetical protein